MTDSTDFEAIEGFREQILQEYPRLGPADTFTFACHPGVTCFNDCCGDVNIFLTPYDILRLRARLGITTEEFLDNYTISPFTKKMKFRVVMLKMKDEGRKPCPFVTEQGCSVYEDRPWPCRMYPVGSAQSHGAVTTDEDFYFVLQEGHCHGHEDSQAREWTIGDWIADQGADEYDEANRWYRDIVTHPFFRGPEEMSPQKMEMLEMGCYDLDKFKRFVLESPFLQRFEVPAERVEQIKTDDKELLRFGAEWVRFAVFGEPTIKINKAVLEAKAKRMGIDPPENL